MIDFSFVTRVLAYYRDHLSKNGEPVTIDRARELAAGVVAVIESSRSYVIYFDPDRWCYAIPSLGHGVNTDTMMRLKLNAVLGEAATPALKDFADAVAFAKRSLRPMNGHRSLWADPPIIITCSYR